MGKSTYFSHGAIRSSYVHFAICRGGHIRLKPGNLEIGSLIVDGQWIGKTARVDVYQVKREGVVKVGKDFEPIVKSAIIDVVEHKLLTMPNKVAVFATEMARRAIMARQALN